MKNRKGIILAGGSGTRLYPLTLAISKQIMPVYDKPMIYYPLSVLMEAGIKEVLIISTPRDAETFKTLLGDGSQWGMTFGYQVKDPRAYGVVEIDETGKAISIEEKPENPKSNYAVPGLYFYTNDVIEIAKNVKPSSRGELEITTVNEEYMRMNKLYVETFGRGMTWFDTGTHDALLETASFVQTIEKRQGLQVCCPEEIAYQKGWITAEQLSKLADKYMKTDYGKYLKELDK